MNIKEALAKLDAADDAHWTADGMPRMDVLQKLTKSPELTRTEVTNAAPDFSRQSVIEAEAPAPSTEDENVEASSEAPKASATPEATAEVADEKRVPAPDEKTSFTEGAEVMVEAVPVESEAATQADPAPAPTEAPTTPFPAPSAPATKLEALQAALAVHTNAMDEADGVKKDAVKAFNAASDQVNTLNRQIEAIVKTDPHAATAGIRDYIAMQHKIRADKVAKARAFLGDSGAKPGDIAKALEVRSTLDKAFLGRKPPRGAARPPTRNPHE